MAKKNKYGAVATGEPVEGDRIQMTWGHCTYCGWDTFEQREGENCRWCDTKTPISPSEIAKVVNMGDNKISIEPLANGLKECKQWLKDHPNVKLYKRA